MKNKHELESIKFWLENKGLERSRLAPTFVKLLHALTEADFPKDWNADAGLPEIFDQALGVTRHFLKVVEDELDQDLLAGEPPWTPAESAKLFSMLLTILAEAGQYRHETYSKDEKRRQLINTQLLPQMGQLREETLSVAKKYLRQPVFSSLAAGVELEIFPLLESLGANSKLARNRYMPFRVIQVGNVVERLYSFRVRTTEPRLVGDESSPGLLREIYDRKYARFGTSGVRGLWGQDFTEERAKRVVQAVCDFLKDSQVPSYVGAEDLQGKRIVIGYDSRKNARLVAEWTAQVCLANGFKVDLADRDTPTPALVYYLTDYLPEDEVAGLINCTASHNPPEWQGVKFNPRLGYPAPTSLTDFIAARANQLQLLDESAPAADLAQAEQRGDLRGFDPIVHYSQWVLDSGQDNQRIQIDPDRIREHFWGGMVVVDEMHGASRGYLPRLLGEIGVRHTVIHAERDPNLPGLDYANPEEPFIDPLKEAVRQLDAAILGLGMDTDADRFGVVDKDGTYYRPNQILAMLVKYLGIDRRLKGRIIATQTGSPLLEKLAGMMPDNEAYQPEKGVIPAFVGHPFYQMRIGKHEDKVYQYTFMVPVGIKYIEEQRRTNQRYQMYKDDKLPENWRDVILIGGEESSGLTTRGHVTDKDGVWANLLIMDMVAYYGKSIGEIWEDTVTAAGWRSYGGKEQTDQAHPNSGRTDVDAILEAKEELINDFLDRFEGQNPSQAAFEGLQVIYSGGIRYDFVELQLRDAQGDDQHYLRVRASGTEPINRIYVESSSQDVARRLMEAALARLEELSAQEIESAHSEWRLVDILASTKLSDALTEMVKSLLDSRDGWSRASVIAKLERMWPTVERRNQKAIRAWITKLRHDA